VERVVERIVEVPVEVERIVEVPVPFEKIVTVEKPVEKIVYKDVPVPVQMSNERVVVKEVPVPVEVLKEVPVPVERVMYKEILVPVEQGQGGALPDHLRSPDMASYTHGTMLSGLYHSYGNSKMQQSVMYGSQQGGNRVGLGLVLERSENGISIKDLVPGLGASRSGQLQAGDVLVSVDGRSVAGYDLDSIKTLTIGNEGSSCNLTVNRGGNEVSVLLTRTAAS